MGQAKPIDRELTLGEVLSKTFELYQHNFLNFVILFAIIEAIIGTITWVVSGFYAFTTVMTFGTGTSAQFANLASFYAGLAIALLLTFVISVVFLPVAEGAVVKMASEEILGQPINLGAAISFAFSRLLSLWVLAIIVGIIVIIGLIALIIPGIILAIMFALSLPVLLIENKGVFDSMSRSRGLVSNRWLKTFATFLVLGIIIAIVSIVLSLISFVAGPGQTILSSILSALWAPAIPIALTVYYYSNVARTSGAQPGPVPMAAAAPGASAQPGMKFCPGCGTQMPSSAVFCPKCGARQPP